MKNYAMPGRLRAKILRKSGFAVAISLVSCCACALAATAGMAGVTAGSGSLLVAGTSTPFIPIGLTSIGILYPAQYASTMCTGISPHEQQKLAEAENTMVTHTQQQLDAMKTHWHANTVRFQVSQGALDYEHEHHLSAYTKMAADVINQALAQSLVTIASMQTESRGCTPKRANGKLAKLPDQATEEAWAQLIPELHLDRRLILEIFNEPKTTEECNSKSWTDWATGCGTGKQEGMVPLGKYVRKLAPNNVLLFDANNGGGTFAQLVPPKDIPSNSAYTIHPYYYLDGVNGWNKRFGDLQASGHTVLVTEWNESASCGHSRDANVALATELVQKYLPAHHTGMVLFSWDAPGNGALVDKQTYAPVDSWAGCSSTGATLAFNFFKAQASK